MVGPAGCTAIVGPAGPSSAVKRVGPSSAVKRVMRIRGDEVHAPIEAPAPPPCHPPRSRLWTRVGRPQGSGGGVGAGSTETGGRVPACAPACSPLRSADFRHEPRATACRAAHRNRPRGGSHPHPAAHESAGSGGSRAPPRRGRTSIGNDLPNRDRIASAEACLLTTRIRILLLPMVQAAIRCACGADEPGTRNQPKMSSTLPVGRIEASPRGFRIAEGPTRA